MERIRWNIPLCLLFLLFATSATGVEVMAQSKAEVQALEHLGLHGWQSEYIDSLTSLTQAHPSSQLLQRAIALQQLRAGDLKVAEEWYQHLSRREQGQYENLLLATIIATNSYELDLAHQRLDKLEKIRLRDPESIALRKEVATHLELVSRLLTHTREVVILDIQSDEVATLEAILQEKSRHLGQIQKESFITPDGKTKWEVLKETAKNVAQQGDQERGHLTIQYQLADGSWADEAISVSILGLPEQARIAYPFLMPDGQTLYFALEQPGVVAKGALGGLDLYVSRYDRDQQKLLVPQLLPLPFNSPSDDLLYIADEAQDLLYLLTCRGGESGTGTLFTIQLSSIRPIQGPIAKEKASLLHATISEEARAKWHAKQGENTPLDYLDRKATQRVPLFTFKHHAIYTEQDLSSNVAQKLLAEYITLLQTKSTKATQLRQLREQFSPKAPSERLQEQILSLERELEDLDTRIAGMRNEIIQIEMKGSYDKK